MRQYVGDAYATCNDLSMEAGAQDFLVKKLPGRVYSQVVSQSCFDLFCGALGSCWLDGVELKVCNHDSSDLVLAQAIEFWGVAANLSQVRVEDKDFGAYVAESVI